jgi:hypothetical protein
MIMIPGTGPLRALCRLLGKGYNILKSAFVSVSDIAQKTALRERAFLAGAGP